MTIRPFLLVHGSAHSVDNRLLVALCAKQFREPDGVCEMALTAELVLGPPRKDAKTCW